MEVAVRHSVMKQVSICCDEASKYWRRNSHALYPICSSILDDTGNGGSSIVTSKNKELCPPDGNGPPGEQRVHFHTHLEYTSFVISEPPLNCFMESETKEMKYHDGGGKVRKSKKSPPESAITLEFNASRRTKGTTKNQTNTKQSRSVPPLRSILRASSYGSRRSAFRNETGESLLR